MGYLLDLITNIAQCSTEPTTPQCVESDTPTIDTLLPDVEAPAAPINPRPMPTHTPAVASAYEATSKPQHFTGTAATAAPAWQNARDQYLNHIMACRACHAPARHYCPTGRELHTTYNHTPMN